MFKAKCFMGWNINDTHCGGYGGVEGPIITDFASEFFENLMRKDENGKKKTVLNAAEKGEQGRKRQSAMVY